MPRFKVQVTFGMATTVEGEFSRGDFDGVQDEGVSEFEDSSYWRSQDVELDGGEISFEIECEDEDEAEEAASNHFRDGQEVEDQNGWTWSMTDVSIDVERLEMSLSEAVQTLRVFLASREDAFREHHPE